MFLLGILTDDSVSYEKAELKNLAANWFNDCAKHNDLPKILQVFSYFKFFDLMFTLENIIFL